MRNVIDLFPKPEPLDRHFGTCPHCRRPGVHVDVDRQNWFVCHRHRVKWLVGENLFSAWVRETENELIAGAARVATYRVVEPA